VGVASISARRTDKLSFVGFHVKRRFACPILTKLYVELTDCRKKKSNVKLNPCSCSVHTTDRQTDRQTDVADIIVAFRNFANAPKTYVIVRPVELILPAVMACQDSQMLLTVIRPY
jgi:hypothetical protein